MLRHTQAIKQTSVLAKVKNNGEEFIRKPWRYNTIVEVGCQQYLNLALSSVWAGDEIGWNPKHY